MSSKKEQLENLASGFRKRTLVTAKLAGKMGLSMARRTLVGKASSAPADSSASIEAARELVQQIGALKGLVMKVGQMASYLPGALPDEAQRVLAALQAESTAISYARVREVVERELGGPPEELFEDFEETPFAAASIGQVHRARFQGRPVAVKVQYPGIEEVLGSDLATFGVLAKISMLGLPMDAAALNAELRSTILDECDYELEARNQRELGDLFARMEGARVPEIIGERSTRRVLTTELIDAMRFAEFVDRASPRAKDRAGEIISGTCLRSLFVHGVYNGDPHPGNYLFDADGNVTFLDFGCVRRFDAEFIGRWKDFARGMIDGEREHFRDRLRALGHVGKEKGFDYDHQYAIMQYLYEPYTQIDPYFTFTDDYVRRSYGVMLFDNPNQRKTAIPPEWLLLNRLQWGMNAVLAKLNATAPWPVQFREAVTAPFDPSPGLVGKAKRAASA
jgi:predicted unusual protein kinase regulating ubiquinone biosynthesis (AarF/ABC1/UbiB family)